MIKAENETELVHSSYVADTTAKIIALTAERDAYALDATRLRAALAWVMRTHVKDGAIIDPAHSTSINAALAAQGETK